MAEGESFAHEIVGFTFMAHHLKAALGQSEITCFDVEAELQQTSDSGKQFKDTEYRWSTLGFSLWHLIHMAGGQEGLREPRHATQKDIQYTAINSQQSQGWCCM